MCIVEASRQRWAAGGDAVFSGRMLPVENGGKLRAEQKNQTRNVTPRQHGNHGADRSIDFVVMKIVQAPRKHVFCGFPKEPANHRAWKSVAQCDLGLWHETIDNHEHCYRHQNACAREYQLQERASEDRKEGETFEL